MNNFIQLLKPLKTPAKYLLYFFIAFVLFYLFGQPPEFRDEVTKKIRLYAENYINTQRNQRELDKFGGDGDYWVHLKRFQFRERAEKFSEEVQERGFQPKQYYGFTDETHPLMILIGPYSSKDEALKIVNRIRSLDIGEIDDKKTKKPRVSEKVDSEFGKIDNENLINFVFKSQRENLDSSKTIEEKIAFQNKLKKLMDQRGLAYRMGGIDMEAGLWSYSFLFPSDDDCYNTRYIRSHWGGEDWLTKYGLAHTPVGESEGNADSPYLIRSEKLGGGFFTDPCEDWDDEGERRAQSLLKNAQEVVSGKETSGGMTEIKNTRRNQTCGNIKYSIVNLGPDDYTGHSRFDHIVANVFNNDGGTALKADSTEWIKLACKDVTGDSQPELILDTWGGGNCSWCNSFYVITDKQTGGQSKVEILYEGTGFEKIEYNQERSIHEVNERDDEGSWRDNSMTLCLDSREGFCKATIGIKMPKRDSDDSEIDLEQGTLETTWWKPGQKKAEGYIKDGKRNGEWQGWHPNGEDRYVRYYKNGEIEESFEYEMKKVESKLPPKESLAVNTPKKSIQLHMDYFSKCTKDKVHVKESGSVVVYSLQASLSCLLSPLSKTEPRFESKGAVKSSYGDSDILVSPEFRDLDSLNETVVHYNSLFDGSPSPQSGTIYPQRAYMIKLKDGQVIVVTSPDGDGVVAIKKISNKYLIAYVAFGGRWVNPHLISTDLKEITFLSSNGTVEVVDLENLTFKVKGRKSYWKKGGAFWFDAIIDKNGEIIKIDNSRVNKSKFSNCYSKNEFIEKWGSELPASHQGIVCFEY